MERQNRDHSGKSQRGAEAGWEKSYACNKYVSGRREGTETKVVNGKETKVDVINDGPKKLAARRKLISNLVDIQETKGQKESKSAYNLRTKDIKMPLIEKIFNVYAPKFAERSEQIGQKGGYTTIHKLGMRRGDAAEWQSSKYCPSELLHEKQRVRRAVFIFRETKEK